MKKLHILLALIVVFSMFVCACKESPSSYNDGTGNSEMLSMENKKISTDDIEFSVVTDDEDERNTVKTYKTEFLYEDFEVKFDDIKANDYIYVTEADEAPVYPKKTLLPEYDLDALKAIMLEYYVGEYGALDEKASFVCQPVFSTKNFTGKLIVTYKVYTDPTIDEFANKCFATGKEITLTCELYDYKIG